MRALLSVLLLLLTACGQPVAAQPARELVQVVKVIDGDTVDVMRDGQRTRLRLIGIDTPETVDPRKPVQCFGKEASRHAHELLDGQTVALELDPSQGKLDRYGRTLAYLWLPDGRNFGETMIRDGYAHEYRYARAYTYESSFKRAEVAARESGAGLWAAETCGGKP
jgi:micrococcal nuclease